MKAAVSFLAACLLAHAQSPHLANIRQLTSGGQNAEAYWSPDGKRIVFCSDRNAKERYEFNIFVADWQ